MPPSRVTTSAQRRAGLARPRTPVAAAPALTFKGQPSWPFLSLLPIAANSGTFGQVQSRVEDQRSRRRSALDGAVSLRQPDRHLPPMPSVIGAGGAACVSAT